MTEKTDAAIIVIGDEILSGRTKDSNIGYIATRCTEIGVDLREVRVVPDEQAEIVAAVNALRARYAYVFTSGGIGPTHDDITADAIAAAFGVGISEDPRAIALLLERIEPEKLNAARRRMARIPHGAELIENSISKAPGFRIGNVFVMAGVPKIMQAMFESIAPALAGGVPTRSKAISADGLPEGAYAGPLSTLADDHPDVSIGSYPHLEDGRFRNEIVVRGKDEAALEAVASRVVELLEALRGSG